MPTYCFKSTYTGHGEVYIDADSLEEAEERARRCDFDDDKVIECGLDEIRVEDGAEC